MKNFFKNIKNKKDRIIVQKDAFLFKYDIATGVYTVFPKVYIYKDLVANTYYAVGINYIVNLNNRQTVGHLENEPYIDSSCIYIWNSDGVDVREKIVTTMFEIVHKFLANTYSLIYASKNYLDLANRLLYDLPDTSQECRNTLSNLEGNFFGWFEDDPASGLDMDTKIDLFKYVFGDSLKLHGL